MGNVLTDGNGNILISNNNALEVTSAIDSNIQPENIKKDVTILGVTGTYEGSGSSEMIPLVIDTRNYNDLSNPIVIQRWLDMWEDIHNTAWGTNNYVNIYKYFTFTSCVYNTNGYTARINNSITVNINTEQLVSGDYYLYYDEQSNSLVEVYND
jgi:hypothetical protein